MASYIDLLRDPRWQRKRLEVLNRSDFKCESCGSGERTLNVHHRKYRKGAKPWEYEPHELVSLCERCHQWEHMFNDGLADLVGRMTHLQKLDLFYQASVIVGDETTEVPSGTNPHH